MGSNRARRLAIGEKKRIDDQRGMGKFLVDMRGSICGRVRTWIPDELFQQ